MTDEDENGDVQAFEGKSNVEKAFWDRIHSEQFYTAEQAPIYKRPMREVCGYLDTTIAARYVLEGTHDYPEWFDPATK